MSDELKREARKQYLKYFRIWFITVGRLAIALLGAGGLRAMKGSIPRTNSAAPSERVYDYGDMLTDEEEEKLRSYISQKEGELGIDLVLVTMKQPVEGTEAKEQYGYRSTGWTQNMQDIADDFWDKNQYGYNKGFEGDGALLLDNRYPGQRGEHLSTRGRVEYSLSARDVEKVLTAVDRDYDSDPYRAYKVYIDTVCNLMGGFRIPSWYWLAALAASAAAAFIYGASHLHQEKARDTTAVNDYVSGGKPVLRSKEDQFIRKSTVSRRIETSSGGSGGGRSGGGGHHHSSSGASHGGGSHRH